jgi:hypothetical protein
MLTAISISYYHSKHMAMVCLCVPLSLQVNCAFMTSGMGCQAVLETGTKLLKGHPVSNLIQMKAAGISGTFAPAYKF